MRGGLRRPVRAMSPSAFLAILLAGALLVPEAGASQTIEERTSGMHSHDGFIPVHLDDETGDIYLEVSRLGEEFLHMISIRQGTGTVGPDRGSSAGTKVLFFERQEFRDTLNEEAAVILASRLDPIAVMPVREIVPAVKGQGFAVPGGGP